MIDSKNKSAILAAKQLEAYNNRNIEQFLQCYDPEVEVYKFPNELLYKGIEKMRKRYTDLFEESPHLHCELLNRISLGNHTIDYERVTGFRNNTQTIHACAIYEANETHIMKVWFINE